MADWEQFDYAFTCPLGVDEDLAVGYERLLAQYRAECSGLELSASAILRVASLCSGYIRHVNNQRRAFGCPDGYANPAMEKNAWIAWLSAAKEHDEYLSRQKARTPAGSSLITTEAVSDVVLTVLERVTDPGLRAQLQDLFVDELEKASI